MKLRIPTLLGTLIPALFLMPDFVFAQSVRPDAGQMLRELTPAPALPPRETPAPAVEDGATASVQNGVRFFVRDIRLRGVTAFAESDLRALLADGIGRELTLAGLDALAARITRHYREAGYLVARAWLPAQDVHDGVVEIVVQEGRIGQVDVNDQAGLATSALAPLEHVVPGAPVTADTLEASLLTLADLPGVAVKSTLRPGTVAGTSDLHVDVTPGRTFNGSVDADTFGSRYTGASRVGSSLYWNNPGRLGDQASLRVQTSGEGFTYSRLGYQVPFGALATRIGVAWSAMHYRLGEDFAALQADGDATVGSIYVLQPLLRSRAASWYGQLQFDDKHLTDRIGATASATDKALRNVVASVNGEFSDGWGGGASTTLALAVTAGQLELDAVSAATDRASARSAGLFTKSNATVQRVHRLSESTSLLLSWSGQWAARNLDSSEKLSLGGPQAVRAYPQGEASGDVGQLATLELQHTLAERWAVQGFYDAGQIVLNRDPWTAASNERNLAGYGLGASYAGGGFTLRAFAAWRAGTDAPSADADRSPRLWVQAALYF